MVWCFFVDQRCWVHCFVFTTLQSLLAAQLQANENCIVRASLLHLRCSCKKQCFAQNIIDSHNVIQTHIHTKRSELSNYELVLLYANSIDFPIRSIRWISASCSSTFAFAFFFGGLVFYVGSTDSAYNPLTSISWACCRLLDYSKSLSVRKQNRAFQDVAQRDEVRVVAHTVKDWPATSSMTHAPMSDENRIC